MQVGRKACSGQLDANSGALAGPALQYIEMRVEFHIYTYIYILCMCLCVHVCSLRCPRRFHRPLLGHPMGSAGPDLFVFSFSVSLSLSLSLSTPGPEFVRGHHACWFSKFPTQCSSIDCTNASINSSSLNPAQALRD